MCVCVWWGGEVHKLSPPSLTPLFVTHATATFSGASMIGTSSYTGPLPIIGFFIVRVTYVGAEPMTVKSEKIKRDLTMAYCTYSTSQKAKKQGKFHYPSLVPSIKNCRI